MRSGILMLRHLGEMEAANRVKAAVHAVYREGKHLTRDMGGEASTSEFADALVAQVQNKDLVVPAPPVVSPA